MMNWPGYSIHVPDANDELEPTLVIEPSARQTVKIKFNKETHRSRYDKESETEQDATLVIEPKE